MIGIPSENRHHFNPNYDYDADDRNSIPMDTTSGGGINIGIGDERRSDGSPHHRHYNRDFMEHDGEWTRGGGGF